MRFIKKENGRIVNLKIIEGKDGGFSAIETKLTVENHDTFDIIEEVVVWERYYKNRRDFYDDFEDVL